MARINTYTQKNTAPQDNDLVPITVPSVRSDAPKGVYLVTWANLKTFLASSTVGLTQNEVDARVRALVADVAEEGNTSKWGPDKVINLRVLTNADNLDNINENLFAKSHGGDGTASDTFQGAPQIVIDSSQDLWITVEAEERQLIRSIEHPSLLLVRGRNAGDTGWDTSDAGNADGSNLANKQRGFYRLPGPPEVNPIATVGNTDRWPLDKITQAQIEDFFDNTYNIANTPTFNLAGQTLNAGNSAWGSPVLSPSIFGQGLKHQQQWDILFQLCLVTEPITNPTQIRIEFIFTESTNNPSIPERSHFVTLELPFDENDDWPQLSIKNNDINFPDGVDLAAYDRVAIEITWLSGDDVTFRDSATDHLSRTELNVRLLPVGEVDYSTAEADITKSLKFLVEQRDIDFSAGQKTIDWEDDTVIAGGNVVLMQGIDGDIVNAGYSETPPDTNYLLKYKGRDIPFKLALFTSNDHISLFTSVSDPELPANLSITFNGNAHTRDSHTNTDEIRRYRFVPQTAITVGDDFTLNVTGTNVQFGTLEHTNPVNRTIIDEELIKKVKSKIVAVSNDDGTIRDATADDYHNRALAIIGQNIRIADKISVSTVNITYEDNFDPWADDAGVNYRGVVDSRFDWTGAQPRDGVYAKDTHSFWVYTAADGWTFPRPQPVNVRGNYANEADADDHISANGQVAEWGDQLHKVTAYTAGVDDGYVWGQLQDIKALIDSLQAVETGLEGAQTSISNLTTQVEELSNPAASAVSVNTNSFTESTPLKPTDNTVQKALNRVNDFSLSLGGNSEVVSEFVKERILGELDTTTELPSNMVWVGTGIIALEDMDYLLINTGLAHDSFNIVGWRDLKRTKVAGTAGEVSTAAQYETATFHSSTNRIIRIGFDENNQILLANHASTTFSLPDNLLFETMVVNVPRSAEFDIDPLSTDVLDDNSEFGFNKKTPIRQHLLYAENQEVSFQRDGATEIYDVNLPPPDAPRREGAEWGSADSKISDALWSGRFSDGFLSLDLRSAGLADPQTLVWRAVGSVGENTASFVNPVGFDRADVNFFTDHLSSPQSWRRYLFIDLVQEPSSFPLVPAFLLVGTGGFTAGQQTVDYASEVTLGHSLVSKGAGDLASSIGLSNATVTNLVIDQSGTEIPFILQRTNSVTNTWALYTSPTAPVLAGLSVIINGTSLSVASTAVNANTRTYTLSGSQAINTTSFTLDITGTGIEFGKDEDTVTERIPLIANDPSGHNTQDSLWWAEDPADSSFTVAQLNAKTFDIEFTNGTLLFQKPAPAALFTSTDISTLNNLAVVTLDKINRVNTSEGGGTFYLQGHKRVHNGADYLRLTLFNDEALTDQANRDDINPTFAHSTETAVAFNFRLADFPATNEVKKTALSALARRIAKFNTPRDAQLQQEINDLRQVTSKLSVTGRPTTDTEPVLGSLHLTEERPDAGERSGGFEAGAQIVDYDTELSSSGTVFTSKGGAALAAAIGFAGAIETDYVLRVSGVEVPFLMDFNDFNNSWRLWTGPGTLDLTDNNTQLSTIFRVNEDPPRPIQSRPLSNRSPTTNYVSYSITGGLYDLDADFQMDITGTNIEFGKDEPVVITGPENLDYTDTVRSGSNSHKFLIIERPFDEDKNDLELLLTADGVTFPDLIGDGRNFVEIPSTSVANRYYYYQLLDAFQEQGDISIQRRSASYAETLYTGKTRSNRGPTLPAASADWLPGELFSLLNPNGPFTGETDVTFTQIAANIIGVQDPFSNSDIYRIAFTESTKGGWIQTDGVDSEEVNSWTHLILGNEAYALSPGVLTVGGNTLKQVIGEDGNLLTGQDSPFNDIDVGDTVRASVRKRDGTYVGGATPNFEIAHYQRQDTTSTDLEDVWHPQALVHPDHEEILQVLSNHFRKDRDIHDAKLFLNHTRGWSDGLSGLDNVPDDFPSAIHSITWHNDISDTNRYRRFVIEVTEAASARSYHEKTFVYRGTEHELFYYTRSGNNNRYRTAAGSQTSDPGSPWRRVNLENVNYEVHEVFTGARAWLFHKGE